MYEAINLHPKYQALKTWNASENKQVDLYDEQNLNSINQFYVTGAAPSLRNEEGYYKGVEVFTCNYGRKPY